MTLHFINQISILISDCMKFLLRCFLLPALFLIVLPAPEASAQDEPRSIDDIRIPSLPYYSYGRGLGLTTPDSTYQLNIRFRMQNRVTLEDSDNRDARIEGMVRRLRLRFDGFVGDPRFLYAIQLSFAPGDIGQVTEGQSVNIIRDAVFYYRHSDRLTLGFGQTKLPGNRQRVNSSGALQLTDRSINNATFTIDRDYGVFLNYGREFRDQFSWVLRTAVSSGNGRNQPNFDTRLAYTGRLDLFPLGTFAQGGAYFEGDLVREQTPKILLGATYHFNKGATKSGGQIGSPVMVMRDLTSIHLDAVLKYQGFAAMAAFMHRSANEPVAPLPTNPDILEAILTGYGYDAQLSYLLPSDYEFIGRFSRQIPESKISHDFPVRNQYSLGVTRYIWEHALKLQTEVTYNQTQFKGMDSMDGWYARFQIEIGI